MTRLPLQGAMKRNSMFVTRMRYLNPLFKVVARRKLLKGKHALEHAYFAAAGRDMTSNSILTSPAFSNFSVTGTLLPSASGCFKPMNMT
jgi:hypothetical protein